jgi:hypothetical protein
LIARALVDVERADSDSLAPLTGQHETFLEALAPLAAPSGDQARMRK